MIPIRDTIPSKNYPIVNNILIGINVLVFLVQLSQGSKLNAFIYMYGLVPARYTVSTLSSYFTFEQQVLALISFMFLHGGFLHLLGNMWSLYIFGDNVEDQLGHVRYLAFYLLCGLISGITHFIFNLHSTTPTIGASGALAGVMGAYFILFPKSKILTLVPVFFLPWFIEIPAFFFLGFWFLMQVLSATGSHGVAGGIAWWAHIGGFVFGVILLNIFFKIPKVSMPPGISRFTMKKKSDRLQVIRPINPGNDPHLYGTIYITQFEAISGVKKLVSISSMSRKKLFKVTVPSGISNGNILRLNGLGRQLAGFQPGDLLLKVLVK